ncbi:MAG: helix-turn-helix transcriptional regulator [Dactylosporangium sp.]|nr:helix-turn-helix transcriptional regulator [Dactylosporangium sp.]NNJ63201.1 helix-turn-helix transcriptional regulator [Dactylosporangium sp.]
MPERLSTIVGRRRLCAAIRRAREDRDLTQQEVATEMEWSLSKLIRVESGAVGVSTTDLRALLALYTVTEPTVINDLMELARAGRRRPWWREYRAQMSTSTLGTLIDLEVVASRLQIFNPSILPGLFQTEQYARAVLGNMLPPPTPVELEARVSIRMRRQQEVLGRGSPPSILAVLDEAVLRRSTGDAATMGEQLDHLLSIAALPTVTIAILPFSAGVFQLAGPFFILSFPDDPDMVYVESSLSEHLLEGTDLIQDYRNAFSLIRDKSLCPEESADLIKRSADEFR